MNLSPKLKKVIRKLIESGDLLSPSPKLMKNGEDVLPLWRSGIGWYGINLEGDIVATDGEKPYKIEKEEFPLFINVALFKGIQRYPELSPLAPVRGESDLTCSFCNGTGKEEISERIDNQLCYCGGLGWIPNQETYQE